MYYNTGLLNDYGLTTHRTCTKPNLDARQLIEMTSNVYQDLDGNGKKSRRLLWVLHDILSLRRFLHRLEHEAG